MRRLAAALLLAAPLLAGATGDATRFRPPPAAFDLLTSETATLLQPLQYSLALNLSYAHNPVLWRYPDGTYDPVIAHQAMCDFGLAVGLVRLVDLGVVLPVALLHEGPPENGYGIDSLGRSLSGAGLGDLRLIPRVALVQERSFGFGLALSVELTAPTGERDRFLGDGAWGLLPRLVGTLPARHWLPLPVRVSGSVGYRVRPAASVGNLRLGDELDVRAGLETPLPGLGLPLAALLDVSLTTAARSPLRGEGLAGLEVMAGVRTYLAGTLVATLAAGPGLTAGLGTPDVRIVLALGFSSKASDRDGDGIADVADSCPDDPEDYDRFADADGCPDTDNDEDGILDRNDRCPNDPEDYEGVRDEDGCPDHGVPDRDEDGFLDSEDECPDQPEDADGFQDEDGCPDLDNDTDGIPDRVDKCPQEKETINGREDWDGCPDEGEGQTVYIENVAIEIKATVLFETNKATIKDESKPLLDQVALQILSHPEIKRVRVEGHTDSVGPDDHNLFLSQARADSVRRYLISREIAAERLEAVGFGETRPIDTNETVGGRSRNRRVEFLIIND